MADTGSSTSLTNFVNHDDLDVATALMANRLSYESYEVDGSEELTSIALSLDGEYLAIASASGTISIWSVRDSGRQVQSLNAGTSVKVSALLWGPATETGPPLFVASSNGFINCVIYRSADLTQNPPKLTSGFVPALVTSMALNPSSSTLAVAYDYTVRLFDLPLTGTDVATARIYMGRVVWMELSKDGRSIRDLPVRSHPWPVKLEWLSDTVICIGLFSRIVALDISKTVPKTSWTIEAPQASELGSFAISPSRKLIAATNLRSGVDWFDVDSSQFVSTTAIEDDYLHRNYMLPVFFVGEKSFVCGHNNGSVIIGGNGLDEVHRITAGLPVPYPSQLLTVARLSPDSYMIAWAVSECLSPTIQVVTISKSPSVEGPSTVTEHSTPPAPIRESLLLLLLQAVSEIAVSLVERLGTPSVNILKPQIVMVLLISAISIAVFAWRESLMLHPFADNISQNPILEHSRSVAVPLHDAPQTVHLTLEPSTTHESAFSYFKPLPIEAEVEIDTVTEQIGDIEGSEEAEPLPERTASRDGKAEIELQDGLDLEEETLEYLRDRPENLVMGTPTVTITETRFITVTETIVSTMVLQAKDRYAGSPKTMGKAKGHYRASRLY